MICSFLCVTLEMLGVGLSERVLSQPDAKTVSLKMLRANQWNKSVRSISRLTTDQIKNNENRIEPPLSSAFLEDNVERTVSKMKTMWVSLLAVAIKNSDCFLKALTTKQFDSGEWHFCICFCLHTFGEYVDSMCEERELRRQREWICGKSRNKRPGWGTWHLEVNGEDLKTDQLKRGGKGRTSRSSTVFT